GGWCGRNIHSQYCLECCHSFGRCHARSCEHIHLPRQQHALDFCLFLGPHLRKSWLRKLVGDVVSGHNHWINEHPRGWESVDRHRCEHHRNDLHGCSHHWRKFC